MTHYRYNARDDAMTAWNSNFTSRCGDGSGDPEDDYFTTLRLMAACRPQAQLLDIGCGLGRIVGLLRHEVAGIVGLEPDPERFAASRADFHDGDRVEILNCSSDRYKLEHPSRTFDMVVVSMVIQHVSTETCDRILADVHDLLAADGVGMVATTQQEVERFTRQSDQAPLDRDAFDRYAVDRAGLAVVRWGQFSYIRPEKLCWFADWMGSSPDAIRDVGTSQYAVVRRRS